MSDAPRIDPHQRKQKLVFAHFYPYRTDRRCRCGCERPLPKRRRQWTSDACSNKALTHFCILRGDSGVIRTELLKRDKGRCADCGLDCEAVCKRLWPYAWAWRRGAIPPAYWTEADGWRSAMPMETREEILNFISEGFPSPNQTWWEAHHIIPVVKGGGGTGLENYATMCIACHKIATRELAAERARMRRSAGQPELPLSE